METKLQADMERLCSLAVRRRLSSLLLLLPLLSGGSTEEFLVFGPGEPIVAVLGGNISLPCRVEPGMSAENMELRWFRSKFSEAVYVYQNGWEQTEELMAQYAGWTSLDREFLTQGRAAVVIHKVQASDNGLYSCFFRKGRLYDEATLELKVAGVGSAPRVHITGPKEDGVRVACSASGWFPKPQVQWRDLSGEKLLAFSEAHARDAEGLYSVEAALVVRERSAGNVTCSLLNPILGQEKAMAIFIPEPFFPQVSPWPPGMWLFLGSLAALGLPLLGAGYYTWRQHSMWAKARGEQARLRWAKKKDRETKEKALKARDELQAQLEWRKAVYLAAWRKAQLYADWRQEKFPSWLVTLDPDSAHPGLVISQEKMSVTLKDSHEDSVSTCSVLGLEGITSGRWHWEVAVSDSDKSQWALGVCRGDVKRKGWYRESPERGFWVVGRLERGYCACTVPETVFEKRFSDRVGVFLDYDAGDVSFYNMTDGSHIFSFPSASFSGTLFPYFMLRSGGVSLTICPKVGGPEGPPVPLSLPGAGLSSDSGVDEVECSLLSFNVEPTLPSVPFPIPDFPSEDELSLWLKL
ncbi:butyrophilin subfamily 1 member A1-like isoform X1 [Saccopteryx leptura]|uniref:butyrophilin subfamily 1 member A1-like isoform X1 n=2 Tax=Saccopteryx leptura TaxID=249018 RepID=UPI00339C234A